MVVSFRSTISVLTALAAGFIVTATTLEANATAPTATPVSPKEPTPVKNKKMEFSTRTDIHACTGLANESCSIDTFVVAKALDNGEIIWERRIYFRKYQASEKATPPVIAVKSIKLQNKKTLQVVNARGDRFEIEIARGHMKNPKEPKEY